MTGGDNRIAKSGTSHLFMRALAPTALLTKPIDFVLRNEIDLRVERRA